MAPLATILPTRHSAAADSDAVNIATLVTVTLDCAESGGVDCSSDGDGTTATLLERLTNTCKRRQRVGYVVTILVILGLGLVETPLLITFISTNTHQTTATTPPLNASALGNATTATITAPPQLNPSSVLTTRAYEEWLRQQGQEVWALPGCQPVNDSVKVSDVLKMDPMDEVQDRELFNYNILVTRCRGPCGGPTRCLPTHTVKKSFLVKYKDEHGDLQYAKREVDHHLHCQCQVA